MTVPSPQQYPTGQQPPGLPLAAAPPPVAASPPAAPPSWPDQTLAAPTAVPAPGTDGKGHVRVTKAGVVWIGLIATAIVLIALLIFIAQNSSSVTVHYFGADGRVPLAVALLFSAVAGLLIAAIPGTVRILQLRRVVKQTSFDASDSPRY
jgi:uncharacterized integral membrane protein